ncbi:hypothetical protein [Maliponia aquimaris]|uniref:Uncharacterized protein n=1 Tax=Maliponia aquimaris TaxID=1673631 RepID=A0A238K2C0_9RHOB|nr:hypothetical protein [Maliponia aquimaris]SMX36923.1 hypothetical protein MAA8898_01114 [Maliponia aquimaris]
MVFVAGHFGEWLQGRLGPDGPLVLVTLACAVRGVHAERLGDGPLRIEGTPPPVSVDQARLCLEALGAPAKGQYAFRPDLAPGGGAGMSTAALVGLARLAGIDGAEVARACLAAEGASDPLMWPAPDRLLWASRQAETLRHLGPVPRCEILGGFWGGPSRTDPKDIQFPDVTDLVSSWDSADLRGKARLASLSATRCTALRGPVDDPMADLAERLGALGHSRAHTGSARALIFAPGTVPSGAAAVLAAAGLTGVFQFATGGAE